MKLQEIKKHDNHLDAKQNNILGNNKKMMNSVCVHAHIYMQISMHIQHFLILDKVSC